MSIYDRTNNKFSQVACMALLVAAAACHTDGIVQENDAATDAEGLLTLSGADGSSDPSTPTTSGGDESRSWPGKRRDGLASS